ncbi:MAG: CPBP family intramembrane metalloprotease [Spirochaetaceae bacterium]
MFTSGAEEYGWTASLYTGLIWAFWHLPIVIYIFYLQGMPPFAMIFSFIDFTVGSVAMSVVYTYFYEKTKSTFFAVYIHAVGNTIPFIASLLITDSYKVSIFTQLLIWIVVAVIVKKNKDIFPNNNKKK